MDPSKKEWTFARYPKKFAEGGWIVSLSSSDKNNPSNKLSGSNKTNSGSLKMNQQNSGGVNSGKNDDSNEDVDVVITHLPYGDFGSKKMLTLQTPGLKRRKTVKPKKSQAERLKANLLPQPPSNDG